MRFARLSPDTAPNVNLLRDALYTVIFVAYNIIYWLPMIFVILGNIDLPTAFVSFSIIIAVRTALNFYRMNVLPMEQGKIFPLRAP